MMAFSRSCDLLHSAVPCSDQDNEYSLVVMHGFLLILDISSINISISISMAWSCWLLVSVLVEVISYDHGSAMK